MATTTFTTLLPTPQPKRPGPPVPPRPQQSSILKTQQRDASSSSSSSYCASSSVTTAATQRLLNKVGLEQPQILNKRPIIANASSINATTSTSTSRAASTSVTTTCGRTVIYKSPSLNLQQRQEEREKRSEAGTQTATSAITRASSVGSATVAKAKLGNGTHASKPPLKLRKAPDVPTHLKPRITTSQSDFKGNETKENDDNCNKSNANNILIVQSPQGVVTLNRHHSMGSSTPLNKPSILAKDTRLSLGKVDFERVGKVQLQQLQPTSQPLPKPRKIVQVPVATLDVEENTSPENTSSLSSNTLHVSLFKRSKTSIENFTSRSNITNVGTNSSGSFLSGKTSEIKNNLKNAAERLFSEIMVNQQKQNALESNTAINTIITKHERAIQHQAVDHLNSNNANNSNNITVVTTLKDYALNHDDNCTRINIRSTTTNTTNNINKGRQVVSAFNSPEKKSAAFHEMLISELAAMRTRSCSMENLQTTKESSQPKSAQPAKESAIEKQFQNYKELKSLETKLKTTNNSKHQQKENHQYSQHEQSSAVSKQHDDDIDADNIEDADGDVEEELKKSLKAITGQSSPRKRTPSGCSSDSSPYGTERSARIRTSDWIEVGDNGKQVTLSSCHISLEDSGLEDEERIDEMSSSGVGDSWDSVKEAEQQQHIQQQQHQSKRSRNVKRIMSTNDLPPLPKSLSGINKMLASDSGLVSDVDTEVRNAKNVDTKEYENQKENNNNMNVNNRNNSNITNNTNNNNNNNNSNNNNNNNSNNNSNNALKDAGDKFNNISVTTAAPTTASISSATPLKEINGNETISEIPPAIPGSKLDTQIATLRKEMFGLRQLDLSLLSQLWALNDSIQEFRTMIQDQEQEDDETYSTHSRSPSPYDSVSSDAEDEILNIKTKSRMALSNENVITTQPKLTKSYVANNELTHQDTTTSTSTSTTTSTSPSSSTLSTAAALVEQQQKSQLLKPQLPKPLDIKPVPRMRSAPPPPPTQRKTQSAPPRPT